MKKIALTLTLILASSSALAKGMDVKLYGKMDTQFGYRQQSGNFKNSDASQKGAKLDNHGIASDTKIGFEASNAFSNGLKYGGIIEINADTSKNASKDDDTVGKKTILYIEGKKIGRFEAGSGDAGVSGSMQTSASEIARGSGGINGKATKWINKKFSIGNNYNSDFDKEFIKWPTLPTDCDYDANAAKITYYTPKFSGLQLGVSYTPNLDHTGTVSDIDNQTKPQKGSPVTAVEKFKEVVQAGISYTTKINDFEIKSSFTAERAKSAPTTPARKGLMAWEVGAVIGYKGFSIAGSYSDWEHTGAPKNRYQNKKYGGGYWTAGVAYTDDKFGISATYFKSKKANLYTSNEDLATFTAKDVQDNTFNKFEILSLGVDYKVAPGFMPYAEISYFKTKHSHNVSNNKGNIYLLGTKLTF